MSEYEYPILIRSARASDLDGLTGLINRAATTKAILPRSRNEVANYLETFVIAEHEGAVAACAALASVDPSHAEIRSVAVDPVVQKLGVGLKMVRFLIDIAEQVDLSRLFLVTTKPDFFAKNGFVPAPVFEGTTPSYLYAMLLRNGRVIDGKTIMTLDLDMGYFTPHTVESIEHLPRPYLNPLRLASETQQAETRSANKAALPIDTITAQLKPRKSLERRPTHPSV